MNKRVDSRYCVVCGVLLVQRPHEPPSKFTRRRTCCNAHRYSSIGWSRHETAISDPHLCQIPARIEPVADWPDDLDFSGQDVRTIAYGAMHLPNAGIVFGGSSAAACADDMDAK